MLNAFDESVRKIGEGGGLVPNKTCTTLKILLTEKLFLLFPKKLSKKKVENKKKEHKVKVFKESIFNNTIEKRITKNKNN